MSTLAIVQEADCLHQYVFAPELAEQFDRSRVVTFIKSIRDKLVKTTIFIHPSSIPGALLGTTIARSK